MKKIIALLLALVMVFALVACASTEKPADNTTNDQPKDNMTADQPRTTQRPISRRKTSPRRTLLPSPLPAPSTT